MSRTSKFRRREWLAITSSLVIAAITIGAGASYQRWSPLMGDHVATVNCSNSTCSNSTCSNDACSDDKCVNGHDHALDDGHQHGLEDGDDHALDDGHDHALEDGDDHALDDGHDHALEDGDDHALDDGHDHALEDGDDHALDDDHDHALDDRDDHALDDGHDHAPDDGHNHAPDANVHEGHDEANSLELNPMSWKNIGLKTEVVKPQTYVKTVSVPAVVVERPGRSQVGITAPLTGTVTRVFPIEGEAVQPDEPLFDLRLTHEDLVTAQRDFLTSAQELDVVKREITRLESVGEGVIAGRRVLEQRYELQKIEATLHAQRQGLLLHGLNESQVDGILTTRRLLQKLTVFTPSFPKNGDHQESQHLFHVQKTLVKPGDHVTAGDSLAVLADHCLLYVEGQAFEDDAQRLIQAAREGKRFDVSAIADGKAQDDSLQLQVLYVADHIDPISRALRFYLQLLNHPVRDQQQSSHRFVTWKYRPGQRMQVRIPLGHAWEDQIVLPPGAVIQEGTNAFVFQQNGEHFDRIPVHVVYRDKDAVVVNNDGSLIGSTLATAGAYQMHLAIKNKSGGGVDPHAGHNH